MADSSAPASANPTLASNRRASHDYFFLEKFEAGLQLSGAEVKSVKDGRVSLQEAYAQVENGQAWLHGLHVQPYEHSRQPDYQPARARRLLMHRGEIDRLLIETSQKGHALIPLRVYIKRGWIKVELALAKGKQTVDKRETLKRKEADREAARAISARRRG
jgi:SsrA-binding protein